MRLQPTILVSALVLTGMATPSLAQGPSIYAYESPANFCPAGLQPVSINGTICCGTPNQTQTYQQALRHPVTRKNTHPSYRGVRDCPAGVKGCN